MYFYFIVLCVILFSLLDHAVSEGDNLEQSFSNGNGKMRIRSKRRESFGNSRADDINPNSKQKLSLETMPKIRNSLSSDLQSNSNTADQMQNNLKPEMSDALNTGNNCKKINIIRQKNMKQSMTDQTKSERESFSTRQGMWLWKHDGNKLVEVQDTRTLDFNRTAFIKNTDIKSLMDEVSIQQLLVKVSFNNENLDEQPAIVRDNPGGLWVFQYPNQFSGYLNFIRQFPISTYIEIGCRWGGAFVFTVEYLSRFHPIKEAIAIDPIDSPLKHYPLVNPAAKFIRDFSDSPNVKDHLSEKFFDLAFIDGDHSLPGVVKDFDMMSPRANILVFHDISNRNVPDSVKFWQELKDCKKDQYVFVDFKAQYADVKGPFLGIGVAVLKKYYEAHLGRLSNLPMTLSV